MAQQSERGFQILRPLRVLPPIVPPRPLERTFHQEVFANQAYQTIVNPSMSLIQSVKNGCSSRETDEQCIRTICELEPLELSRDNDS